MLRITISKNAQAAVEYFTNSLSKDDYFFSDKDVVAIWEGKAAAMLGMGAEVTKADFEALAKGVHPRTGKRLTLRQGSERRSGYELVWNPSKSVSIAYAVTKDQAILKAHNDAVMAAMSEVEANMQTQANEGKQKYYQTTGNIVFASFTHFTTRPVEDKNSKTFIPDCHLHTHSFIMNCTWNEDKKRFQAIEMGNIHKLAPYYEAVYHSHLSKNLVEAGYEIERTGYKWELKGISRKTIEKFSKRTELIEKVAKAKGITDAKKKGELGAKTRVSKTKSIEENKLFKIWEERLSSEELNNIKNLKVAKNVSSGDKETLASKALDAALVHHLERNSALPEKRVLATALELGYGTFRPDDAKRAMQDRNDVLSAHFSTVKYVTTKETVGIEDALIEFASSTKATFPAINGTYKPKQAFLSEEQKTAVTQLLSNGDQVMILAGSAGVGKTTLLTEFKKGIEDAGLKLMAFAPSAAASRGVLNDKGFAGADTITTLVQNKELQNSAKGKVILIDEAGMVGSRTMLALFKIAKEQKARIVLSGDPKQHTSVESGDALRQLIEKSRLDVASVETVIRQKKNQPYQSAIQSLAKGDTMKGFEKLDKIGAIVEIEDTTARQEQLAKDYTRSIEKGRTALVVSPTHAEGEAITKVIRNRLKETGKIKGKELEFKTQHNISLTEVQKKDNAQYGEGMIVQFHQNVKGGYKAGEKYQVVEKNDKGEVLLSSTADGKKLLLPMQNSEQFQVYRETETKIAKNDIIRVTNNGRTLENTKIHNGQEYSVTGFTKDGHIKLSNGKTLDKNYRNFGHGYVSTSYSSQGKDAQDVYVAQSALSYPASNEKQFYVTASRGTESLRIYCDDKAELQRAISRSSERMSAREIAEKQGSKRTQENRKRYYDSELNRKEQYERTITKQPEPEVPSAR